MKKNTVDNDTGELIADTDTGGSQSKGAEQIASENHLDMNIADASSDYSENNAGTSNEMPDGNAENALYGLISIVPIGLGISGLKNTAAVWSDDVCKAISKAALPVLRKYTFGQKLITFLETGGGVEELGLAMALVPVVLASANAYKLDAAEFEKEVKDVGAAGAENGTKND